MRSSFWIGASGLREHQRALDVVAHNVANVNTTAFKRERMEFQDLMYQTLREPGLRNFEGEMSPAGIHVGLGVRPAATQRIFEQGSLNRTENALDLALTGEGFYQITLPDGNMAYTRDGAFKLSSEGTLVTSAGFFLYPNISIPEGGQVLTVDGGGALSVVLPGDESSTQIGQLELVRFINPAGLRAIGGSLFTATDASGQPLIELPGENGMGTISQGYVEASNVQVVEEMVNMISAQRAFEIVSKAIQVSEEMLQVTNNMKR